MNALSVVNMTTKTVLLIHKEPNMREVVQACLTDLGGWNVGVASSVVEGLQQARLYPLDAIILDISIAEIDGLLFIKQLRSQPATQEIPIVILTVRAKWFNLQQSLLAKYKVATVIMNPFDLLMLSFQIANVLGWDLDS